MNKQIPAPIPNLDKSSVKNPPTSSRTARCCRSFQNMTCRRHTDTRHTDARHTDTPHIDTQHTDTPHTDSRHTDSWHTDSRYTDSSTLTPAHQPRMWAILLIVLYLSKDYTKNREKAARDSRAWSFQTYFIRLMIADVYTFLWHM
jgi:hypothetical protein